MRFLVLRVTFVGTPSLLLLLHLKSVATFRFLALLCSTVAYSAAFSSFTPPPPSSLQQQTQQSLPDIQAAVIVPGFLTGGDAFKGLAASLSERGIPTVAVPMPAWHWIPCLGGRSMRPILERLDATVRHVAAGNLDAIPPFSYSVADLWSDFFHNPGGLRKVGGSDKVDEYPVVNPRGRFPLPENGPKGKIALIGHSAGGWISRIYLSERSYGGRGYCGQNLIHTLVTLGSPHLAVSSPAFEGIAWANEEPVLPIRQLAVGGVGFKGDEWGALTRSSYAFCCADGSDGTLVSAGTELELEKEGFCDALALTLSNSLSRLSRIFQYDGDGVTPYHSAVAWNGAQQLCVQNVTHFCWSEIRGSRMIAPELTDDHANGGHPWYGDDSVLDQWVDFLKVP